MPESITAWPYALINTRSESPLSEPVKISRNSPPSSIVVRSGELITIASGVANGDVMTLVNQLRSGTMWSIFGDTYRFAGTVSIREAETNYSIVTAQFHRMIS